ncbi:uncharacterized protein LOC106672096 [Cimex lectularius]|uniref:Uncharacterized protein n=1 Tax=Cimex lectularius TaxID=79782 RepID=A0A8I6S897_CIMLE|nr:uncharacterized protein LOC106672096 [Cimex lectularius]
MASAWLLFFFSCNFVLFSSALDQIALGKNSEVERNIKIEELLTLTRKMLQESIRKTSHVPLPEGLDGKQDSLYRLFFEQSREMAMRGRKGKRPTFKDLCCIHTWPPENLSEHTNASNRKK